MAEPALSSKLGSRGTSFVWSEYTFLLELSLVASGRSMGGIYPGQSAARTGGDYLPPSSTFPGGSTVQRQGGGAWKWSVAVHWVRWPWGFLDGAGQGQPPPVFCLGTLPEL